MHFKMLSAIFFNMDQSKILSSGNGLNHCLMENDFKTLFNMEKMQVTFFNNDSCFHNVSHPMSAMLFILERSKI